jgi:hypothetical protein
MRFLLYNLFLVILFLTRPVFADVLLDWLMHSDGHIVNDHIDSMRWIRSESNLGITQTVSVPSNSDDGLGSFREHLQVALQKISKPGENLYIYLDSHGSPGSVCHHDSSIRLDSLVSTMANEIKNFEAKGGAAKINLIYNACYSGSIAPELEKHFGTSSKVKSPLTAVMAAPDDRFAHSGILRDYFEKASKSITAIKKQNLSICEGCSHFDNLAKLVGGYEYNSMDRPTVWSSNPQVSKWTVNDYGFLNSATNRNPDVFEHLLLDRSGRNVQDARFRDKELLKQFGTNRVKANSLSEYLISRFPQTALSQWGWIQNLEKLDDIDKKAKLLKKILSDSSKSPLIKGAALGFLAENNPKSSALIELTKDFESDSFAKGASGSVLYERSLYQKARFDVALQNHDFKSAAHYLEKMNDIPQGWQYSASPLHAARISSIKQLDDWYSKNPLGSEKELFEKELIQLKGPGKRKLYHDFIRQHWTGFLDQKPALLEDIVKTGMGSTVVEYRRGDPNEVLKAANRLQAQGVKVEDYDYIARKTKSFNDFAYGTDPALHPAVRVDTNFPASNSTKNQASTEASQGPSTNFKIPDSIDPECLEKVMARLAK